MRLLRWLGVGLVVSATAATLAACAPEGKQDASQLPEVFSDADAAGKRDSLSKPRAGGTLRVGQYQEGRFTASRGWIAYEIELTAGPIDVFLHGQAPGFGDPLDTVVYVLGPQKPNGKFPTQVLAFNDDADPGHDVGSHMLIDVPADGTYRVVVSSYENWEQYPINATRGDYKVIVKCPRDGGSDACGLAVQFEGGECREDADCASGLHCEGEPNCPPGALCKVAQLGTCTGDYTWFSYAPRQCGQNPWSESAAAGDGVEPVLSLPEAVEVDNYFESNGVQVLEVGFVHDAEPRLQCQACSCPRGDVLLVKVPAWDALHVENELGFTRVAAGQWQELKPVQCGGNPWEENADRWEEERQVVSWLGTQGVQLQRVGFVEKADAFPMCRACSCARGDRLVVQSASVPQATSLAELGFVDVYRP